MNTNERFIKILQAPAEQQLAIDRILSGETPMKPAEGPLLINMSSAAKKLGVSRATLWRMINAKRIEKVEILPGSFRVRASDIAAFVS